MFDIRTKLSADVVREINRHFPNQVFTTIIPRSVRLAEAPSLWAAHLGLRPRLKWCHRILKPGT